MTNSMNTGFSIKKIISSMPFLIVISIVMGAIAGSILGEQAKSLEIFPKIFMWFIKNLTPFLIFLAISSGILSIGSLEQLRRLGLKAGAVYMGTAVFAVIIGITAGLIYKPGVGFSVPQAKPIMETSFVDTILSSPLLSLVVMTVLLSVATLATKEFYQKKLQQEQNKNALSEKETTKKQMNIKEYTYVIDAIEKVISVIIGAAKVIFKGIGWVIWLAPLAVFGAIAALFSAKGGLGVLWQYAALIEAFLHSVVFQFIILGIMIYAIARLNPIPFFIKVWPIMVMAFSTSSSKATLPYAMDVMEEQMGGSPKGVRFILPLGATINMNGTAIYLGLCGVLFAQAYNIELTMTQYLILAFTCTFGSIGAAGLPGGSIIFMPMVLAAVGIPAEGIPMIIAVDRILDMIRTMTNITSDCALALALDANEGGLNQEEYYGKKKPELTTQIVNNPSDSSLSDANAETW